MVTAEALTASPALQDATESNPTAAEAAVAALPGGSGPIAILGGGALGLTVALRLAQAGRKVVVLEREPVAGGLAAGFRPAPEMPGGGPFLEKFYHHLFRSDTTITGLINELGLGNDLIWPEPVNSLLYGGKLWRPYTPAGILGFSPLPLIDRLRMSAVLALLKFAPSNAPFEGHTAERWLTRWMGRPAFETFWKPLLQAKFGAFADRIAMPWFWARIHYRSFALGYLQGGFQRLYDALVAEIRRLGGEVLLGAEVTEVHRQDGEPLAWRVAWRPAGGTARPAGSTRAADATVLADARGTTGEPGRPGEPGLPGKPGRPGEPGVAGAGAEYSGPAITGEPGEQVLAKPGQRRFESVVTTLATRLTVRLIPQLPESFRRQYDWGDALGAHCLVISLRQSLLPGGEYWVNVNDPGYPFLVAVEHTNYQPPEAYGGRRLIYLGNYLPMNHRVFGATKDEIMAEFLPALKKINPDFDPSWVQESWSFGAPYAQPVVTTEYPAHIPPLRAPLPGLWIGSMFQVYPQDRGQNYSMALGNRLAAAILTE